MELECYAVVKKDQKWFIGKISGLDFIVYKQVKELADVDNVSSYVKLKDYLKSNNKDPLLEKVILDETGLSNIYVLSRPSYCGVRVWNKYWWNSYNSQCSECTKGCKQSHFADIWKCPEFEES